MADLIWTKCGRIQYQEKGMLRPTTLTSYYKVRYKSLFSPPSPNYRDFVQNPMGYHSEVFAILRMCFFQQKTT